MGIEQPDQGASADADRAATPSEPSPAVSGVASIPCAGDYAVLKDCGRIGVRKIAKVTPLLVKFDEIFWPRQARRSEVLATMPNKDAAERLAQALNGAIGDCNVRIRKAQIDFDERWNAARKAYADTAKRLIAKARNEQVQS